MTKKHKHTPELLEVARALLVVQVGPVLYIGFMDEDGAGYIKVPPDLRPFVERWAAKRNAAIAKAEGRANG